MNLTFSDNPPRLLSKVYENNKEIGIVISKSDSKKVFILKKGCLRFGNREVRLALSVLKKG